MCAACFTARLCQEPAALGYSTRPVGLAAGRDGGTGRTAILITQTRGKGERCWWEPGQPAIQATRHVQGDEAGVWEVKGSVGDCVCDKILRSATTQRSPGKSIVVRKIQGHGSAIMDKRIRKGFLQPFKIMINGWFFALVSISSWLLKHFCCQQHGKMLRCCFSIWLFLVFEIPTSHSWCWEVRMSMLSKRL